ncbi:MAG: hypothetical protein J07HX64_01475 [halophilic archaeon J07HX64]|nr:MAG: hypothetical protein J07HX64_01475 [halophilic archaeon J07HX64]
MGRLETALGVFGVLATLFGVGLVLAPGLVGSGPVEGATDTVASAGTAEVAAGAWWCCRGAGRGGAVATVASRR